jgi:hypothetical protein
MNDTYFVYVVLFAAFCHKALVNGGKICFLLTFSVRDGLSVENVAHKDLVVNRVLGNDLIIACDLLSWVAGHSSQSKFFVARFIDGQFFVEEFFARKFFSG